MPTSNASSEIEQFLARISGATKRKWVKAIDYRRSENWDDDRIWTWIKAETGDPQAPSDFRQKTPKRRRLSPKNGESLAGGSIRHGALGHEVPNQMASEPLGEAHPRTIFLTETDDRSGKVLERAHLFRPQTQFSRAALGSAEHGGNDPLAVDKPLSTYGESSSKTDIRQDISTQDQMTGSLVILDAFRTDNPVILDASRQAWGFAETLVPGSVHQAPLDQRRNSPYSGESSAHEGIRHAPQERKPSLADLLTKAGAQLCGLGLYGFARAILYVFIIAFSRQPVESLFQSLDVFGSSQINSIAALIATITMDLLAMNLFGRAVESAFGGDNQKLEKCLAFGIPALLIVAANVLLTSQNLNIKTNVAATAKSEVEWKTNIHEAKKVERRAGEAYAAAKAAFLAKKWKGALVPDDCESGKASCRGPYIEVSAGQQEEYLTAKTGLDLATQEVKKLEDKKPELSDASSEGGVAQKLAVYLILWACILLSYVYQPRANSLEPRLRSTER